MPVIVFFKKLLAYLNKPKIEKSKKEIYYTSIKKYIKDLSILREQQKESQA